MLLGYSYSVLYECFIQEVTEDIVRKFRSIVDKMSEEADDGEPRILVTFTDRSVPLNLTLPSL